eukprot:4394875-Prymnesium_polylepis.1
MVKGSAVDGWALPCSLEPCRLEQEVQRYNLEQYDWVAAAEDYLGVSGLGKIHEQAPSPPGETPPTLQRAQVQAQLARAPTRQEKADARRLFKFSAAWDSFLALYRRFIHEVIVPQWGVDLLYQATPVLRVVLPGSVAPCKPHCDADYFHDANEINYWLPMSRVWGSNTLWSESSPGAADFAPFELEPGQMMRFYGNRCRHYTEPNDTDGTRVSIDFRVVPLHLHVPQAERDPQATALMQSHWVLDAGGYYAVARVRGEQIPRRLPDDAAAGATQAARDAHTSPGEASRQVVLALDVEEQGGVSSLR